MLHPALLAKAADEVALEGRGGCPESILWRLLRLEKQSDKDAVRRYFDASSSVNVITASASSSSSRQVVFKASEAMMQSSLGIGDEVVGVKRTVIEIIGRTRTRGCRRTELKIEGVKDLYHIIDNLVSCGFVFVVDRDSRVGGLIYLDRFSPPPEGVVRLKNRPITRLRPELYSLRIVSELRKIKNDFGFSTPALDMDNIDPLLPFGVETMRDRRAAMRQIAAFTVFGAWASEHFKVTADAQQERRFILSSKNCSVRNPKKPRSESARKNEGGCVDRSSADLFLDALSKSGAKGMTSKELSYVAGIAQKPSYRLCNMLGKRGKMVNHLEVSEDARTSERRYFIDKKNMKQNRHIGEGTDIIEQEEWVGGKHNVTMQKRAQHVINELRKRGAISLYILNQRIGELERRKRPLTHNCLRKTVEYLSSRKLVVVHTTGIDTAATSLVAKGPAKLIISLPEHSGNSKEVLQAVEELYALSKFQKEKKTALLKLSKEKAKSSPKSRKPILPPVEEKVAQSTFPFVNALYALLTSRKRKRNVKSKREELFYACVRCVSRILISSCVDENLAFASIANECVASLPHELLANVVIVMNRQLWIEQKGTLKQHAFEHVLLKHLNDPCSFLRSLFTFGRLFYTHHIVLDKFALSFMKITLGLDRWGEGRRSDAVKRYNACFESPSGEMPSSYRDLVQMVHCISSSRASATIAPCGAQCQFNDEDVQPRRAVKDDKGTKDEDEALQGLQFAKTNIPEVERSSSEFTCDVSSCPKDSYCVDFNGLLNEKVARLFLSRVALFVYEYPGTSLEVMRKTFSDLLSIAELRALTLHLEREGLVKRGMKTIATDDEDATLFPCIGSGTDAKWAALLVVMSEYSSVVIS